MNVNLRSVLVVTQRVLGPMQERRTGRVINISSMAGKEGLPNLAHYCATKFGVIGLTQAGPIPGRLCPLRPDGARSLPSWRVARDDPMAQCDFPWERVPAYIVA
jgi:short chain dehydrogenase